MAAVTSEEPTASKFLNSDVADSIRTFSISYLTQWVRENGGSWKAIRQTCDVSEDPTKTVFLCQMSRSKKDGMGIRYGFLTEGDLKLISEADTDEVPVMEESETFPVCGLRKKSVEKALELMPTVKNTEECVCITFFPVDHEKKNVTATAVFCYSTCVSE
jgi:hypothetical protein